MNRRLWTVGEKIFQVVDILLMLALCIVCVLPMFNVVAMSFSDRGSTAANLVRFWPVNFQWTAYQQIFKNGRFVTSFVISVLRTVVGTVLQMLLIILAAYPLSKESNELRGRNVLTWIFFFPMLFSGGLIPTYLLIRSLGLINNLWVLVLNTGLIPVFSVFMMMNFIKRLPQSLIEAAQIDGANHVTVLWRVVLPLSMASIATLSLFAGVGYWNEWFTAKIYLNDTAMYPLQTRLQSLVVGIDYSKLTKEEIELMANLSSRSFTAAQIVVATIPILCVYPFLQRYFATGIVLGAIKE